jgi:hypothetical protein
MGAENYQQGTGIKTGDFSAAGFSQGAHKP